VQQESSISAEDRNKMNRAGLRKCLRKLQKGWIGKENGKKEMIRGLLK
jgi:hypothetical protein